MNNLQIFNYNGQQVRTIQQEGELWWVLTDVCEALDLKSPHKVAARLDEDEKGRTIFPTPGGQQEVTIINEPGLYSVVLRSSKPEAKAFKRWITHEVLPSIRKTGSYTAQPDPRIDTLADEVRKLTQAVAKLTEQSSIKMIPPGNGERTIPGKAARRRWMRTLNEKLDLLEERFNASRNEILHKIYVFVEQQFDILLDEERLKAMERNGLDDCTTLEVIFYNEDYRKFFQDTIDCNLEPEDRGW